MSLFLSAGIRGRSWSRTSVLLGRFRLVSTFLFPHGEAFGDGAECGVGNRQCVGKVLAYAELRLVTATLLKHFDVAFAPGYDPDEMWRDMQDQVTAQPGKVLCVFTPRKDVE
jgi:hypothetical protein